MGLKRFCENISNSFTRSPKAEYKINSYDRIQNIKLAACISLLLLAAITILLLILLK